MSVLNVSGPELPACQHICQLDSLATWRASAETRISSRHYYPDVNRRPNGLVS
jgi:hypothetical protein